MMEEMNWDDGSGQLITGSFMDYCMPRADDMPSFEIHSNPDPTPTNPLGIKGAGESGTVGAMPVLTNAINDALRHAGKGAISMPASPQKIWAALTQ